MADLEHPLFQSVIDQRYVEVCSPEQAFDWLREQTPPVSVYRNRFSLFESHDDIERVLLERRDPLIDHGLARYGWSHEVAAALYPRLGISDRIIMRACHIAAAGPMFPEDAKITPDLTRELRAWATNPNIGDGHFEALFKREGVFEHLSDEAYMGVIRAASYNKRLHTPYETEYIDGFDDYLYHEVFANAWDLVMRVDLTQMWAGVLSDLLQNCVASTYKLDVELALERWQIDDVPYDKDRPFGMSPSWYLRACIARLERDERRLLSSRDAACRAAFYMRFDPTVVTNWPDFAELDSHVFFEHALRNDRIWRSTSDRRTLERLSWRLPDPTNTVDAPNSYRARENRVREENPAWFEDEDE